MKILFSSILPFSLADGGARTLITAIRNELSALGVDVEFENWWDNEQSGDILHFFGRPQSSHLHFAKKKGYKTVMTEFLDMTSCRSPANLFLQRWATKLTQHFLHSMTDRLGWDVYTELDAMIYSSAHELRTAKYLFNANIERGHIIPHGLDTQALKDLSTPCQEKDHLLSIATITERKQSLLLARAAKLVKVPVVFVGKPYTESDPFFKDFQNCIDDTYVRYMGFVSEEEKNKLLRSAKGFVLLSDYESGCIAVYEAAAAGLPMLLPKRPWAVHNYAKLNGVKIADTTSLSRTAQSLESFYNEAHRKGSTTFPIDSWKDIAEKYLNIYKSVLNV